MSVCLFTLCICPVHVRVRQSVTHTISQRLRYPDPHDLLSEGAGHGARPSQTHPAQPHPSTHIPSFLTSLCGVMQCLKVRCHIYSIYLNIYLLRDRREAESDLPLPAPPRGGLADSLRDCDCARACWWRCCSLLGELELLEAKEARE